MKNPDKNKIDFHKLEDTSQERAIIIQAFIDNKEAINFTSNFTVFIVNRYNPSGKLIHYLLELAKINPKTLEEYKKTFTQLDDIYPWDMKMIKNEEDLDSLINDLKTKENHNSSAID